MRCIFLMNHSNLYTLQWLYTLHLFPDLQGLVTFYHSQDLFKDCFPGLECQIITGHLFFSSTIF